MVPARDAGDEVRDGGCVRGLRRARQEPSPRRLVRRVRGAPVALHRRRPPGGVRARPGARAVPGHRGRHGAHRAHRRRDPAPRAHREPVDGAGDPGHAEPRRDARGPAPQRGPLALHGGLDRLPGPRRERRARDPHARPARDPGRGRPPASPALAPHRRAVRRPRVAAEPALHALVQPALRVESRDRAPAPDRVARRLLLPARRGGRVEPPLRPARPAPVPVRAAAGGGPTAGGDPPRAPGGGGRRLVPGRDQGLRPRLRRVPVLPDGGHHPGAGSAQPRRGDRGPHPRPQRHRGRARLWRCP